MSNAFEPTNPADSCAYCGRVRANLWHKVTPDPGTHPFVEPAQPEPSGDEAKVRETPDGIAYRWLQLHTMMPPAFSDLCQRPECDHARHLHAPSCGHVNHDGAKNCACSGFVGSAMSVADALLGAVREAYAAGARAAEDGYLVDIRQARWGHGDNDAIDDELVRLHNLIIARRGSEGK